MTDGSSTRPTRWGLWLIAPLALVACGLPSADPTTPKGAYYGWIEARGQGSVEALWPHVHPEIRSALDRWCQAERETLSLLSTPAFDQAQRSAALAQLDGGRRASCENGQSLLTTVVGDVESEPLNLLARLGARERRVQGTGASRTLSTWAGDEFVVEMSTDGRWFVAWPDGFAHVRDASAQAVVNLRRVRDQHDLSVSKER